MSDVTTSGIDLAKHVFYLYGVDRRRSQSLLAVISSAGHRVLEGRFEEDAAS